jgi:hypothetical protein
VRVAALLVVEVGVGLYRAGVHHLWQRNSFVQSAHVLQPDAPGRAAQAAQRMHCASCLLPYRLYMLSPLQLSIQGQA